MGRGQAFGVLRAMPVSSCGEPAARADVREMRILSAR